MRGAIIGFGQVAAQGHLPAWLASPEVQIAAICDPEADRRHHAFSILRGVRVYDDVELMLDGERPDFVDVASPPLFHYQNVRAALESGAHVLVEKPLCLTLAHFDELMKLAAARSRILMCVHNWKFAPAYLVAAQTLHELGEIRSIALSRMRTQPAGAAIASGEWRRESSSGGGILIDHGWHVFYLMHWLMGGLRPLLVSAHLGPIDDISAEESADIRVIFRDDKIATAHLTWRAPVRRTSAVIYGERGMLEIEGDRVLLADRDGGRMDLSVIDAPDDSYHSAWFGGVARAFIGEINNGAGAESERNPAEARTALALVIGARESALNGGKTVEITG
ncbi:MAG: Gfo/Idh/MocA family protein [Candidatus Binataceae bacterium]